MIGSEAHFRATLSPERACGVLKSLVAACDTAQVICGREGLRQPLSQAQIAFDLASTCMDDAFDSDDGVRMSKVNGQVLWIVEEAYALRVKKLGPGYTPSNQSSGQQTRISQQLSLDGMPPLVYLTAGTRYSAATGLPVEHVVVKHYPGKTGSLKAEWVVDLAELAAGALIANAPSLLDHAPAIANPGAVVRSRRRQTTVESGT